MTIAWYQLGMHVLVGDLGGTKALLALVDDQGHVSSEQRLLCKDHPSFGALVAAYLAGLTGPKPLRACFAIAGPIEGPPEAEHVKLTNLPWAVDARELAATLGLERVRLVNDFVAQARAVLAHPEKLVPLVVPAGAKLGARPGPIAVIGAGTGFGHAILLPGAAGRVDVIATEGGHVDFAPVTDVQIEILKLGRTRFGRVSVERVLSGPGLALIYDTLAALEPKLASAEVAERMRSEDPGAVIVSLGDTDPLCTRTLELFCDIYGQEAGNVAVRLLAEGGVVLGGGIATRIMPKILAGGFARAYLAKAPMEAIVGRIPVYVMTDPAAGLLGAAALARG